MARWQAAAAHVTKFIKNKPRACPYLDNEAKNRLNRQQNKANCADNIGIMSNNLTQFCQI